MLFFVALFNSGVDLDFSLKMEDLSWREEAAGVVEEGSLHRRVVFLLFAAWGAVGMRRPGRLPLWPQGAAGKFMAAFAGLALVSMLWSDYPGFTARRLFVVGALCIAAASFAARSAARSPVLLACVGGAIPLCLGVTAELSLGTFTPWIGGYRFAGIAHPNATGLMAGVFVLACIVVADSNRAWRRMFQMSAAVGAALLILTKSRTAFVAFLIGLFVYKSLVSGTSKRVRYVMGFGLIFLVLLVLFGDAVFPALQEGILLGRSEEGIATLTGRTGLWIECLEYFAKRPLLGYGFDSFWTPDRIEEISFSQGWGISSSHSVYLEYALGLGALGCLLFVALMCAAVARASRLFQRTDEAGFAFICALLVFFLAHGMLDTMAIAPGFVSFLITLCVVEVGFVARWLPETERPEDLRVIKQRPREEGSS